MAGGKETPRQKMIGMMYLVLTALLALNVSKDIIAAFVTLDEKLDNSSVVIAGATSNTYGLFDSKRAAILAEKGDTKTIDFWQEKASDLKLRTKQIIHFILGESNKVILDAEKKDWVLKTDEETGLITELKSIRDIEAKDDYDAATRAFVGSNPKDPIPEGVAIMDSLNQYRNDVTEMMGNYKQGPKEWKFTAPDDISGLSEALKTANPEDTFAIAQVYRSLTIPSEVTILDAGKETVVPWPSAMFDRAPVVAAAAIFTSLKLDVLNGESHVADFMLSKVDAPTFNFNKIEPLAFARTSYINAGDSLSVRVMIAAYDSTDVPPIRYGVNDSISGNWVETTGAIKVVGNTPGEYNLTGVIGVKEKGELNYKPWNFRYQVGKPSGTVSLPDMNVLYRGFDNRVEGAASGFPNYNLTGGGNVTLTKTANGYVAKPGSDREAKINIVGVAEDGSTSNLGSFSFRVQNLPKPEISLGRIADGEEATSSQIRASQRLFAGYPPEIPLNAQFTVISWKVSVTGVPRPISGTGANLSGEALRLLNQATSGSTISIMTDYREPGGTVRKKSAVFSVK